MTVKAKAQRRQAGVMNQTEAKYAAHLLSLKDAGLVYDFAFEGVTFVLANRTRYTPDFLVITQDGSVEFHEVKGYWRDDAKVKIKIAARMFPWFTFRAYRWKNKTVGWLEETFDP